MIAALSVGSALAAAAPARAAITPACTVLPNIAHLDLEQAGAPASINSNTASVTVAELVDLRLTASSNTARAIAVRQDAVSSTVLTLTNTGNGREAFVLTGAITGIDGAVQGFAIDKNADGSFDAGDLRFDNGAATPVLSPGESVQILVFLRGGAVLGSGTLTVDARAATGSGKPGTDVTGTTSPCEAVTGANSAAGSVTVGFSVGPDAVPGDIQVIKTQAVVAPNGSELTVPGSVITYTIESRFGGSGAVHDARIADPIPVGTRYIPGSLRLDGAALTDAADADAGNFDGAAIHVALGTINGAAVRSVSFQVTIPVVSK